MIKLIVQIEDHASEGKQSSVTIASMKTPNATAWEHGMAKFLRAGFQLLVEQMATAESHGNFTVLEKEGPQAQEAAKKAGLI